MLPSASSKMPPYLSLCYLPNRNGPHRNGSLQTVSKTFERLGKQSYTVLRICKKYQHPYYKNQHPNENVPEVSAAIVQTLQKKLIKDQTYKKRKAKRKKRKV